MIIHDSIPNKFARIQPWVGPPQAERLLWWWTHREKWGVLPWIKRTVATPEKRCGKVEFTTWLVQNMSSSIGMIRNPINMGKYNSWQPNHQPATILAGFTLLDLCGGWKNLRIIHISGAGTRKMCIHVVVYRHTFPEFPLLSHEKCHTNAGFDEMLGSLLQGHQTLETRNSQILISGFRFVYSEMS